MKDSLYNILLENLQYDGHWMDDMLVRVNLPAYQKQENPEVHLASLQLGGSGVKNLPANAGNAVSIPGSGRCPGGGNGNPLCACLGNLMDRGTWWATVYGVAKSRTD